MIFDSAWIFTYVYENFQMFYWKLSRYKLIDRIYFIHSYLLLFHNIFIVNRNPGQKSKSNNLQLYEIIHNYLTSNVCILSKIKFTRFFICTNYLSTGFNIVVLKLSSIWFETTFNKHTTLFWSFFWTKNWHFINFVKKVFKITMGNCEQKWRWCLI